MNAYNTCSKIDKPAKVMLFTAEHGVMNKSGYGSIMTFRSVNSSFNSLQLVEIDLVAAFMHSVKLSIINLQNY